MNTNADKVMVDVRNLAYTFAGRTIETLHGISLTIQPGSWTVITGPTGSGKSTLLRALSGSIPDQSAGQMQGVVHVDGLDTRDANVASLARRVGLVLQSCDDQICTASVESEIAFGLENLCHSPDEIASRVDKWLRVFQLVELRNRHPHTLSGGQKQRLMLASVMAMEPRVLLLDEPLAQLDSQSAAELLDILQRLHTEGLTIVVAEHRLDGMLECADRILVLEEGRVAVDCAKNDPRAGAALALRGLMGEAFDSSSLQPNPPCVTNETWVATVDSMSYRLTRQSSYVWQNVAFQVARGDRIALVGRNGSGKSSLLSVVAGVARASTGRIRWATTQSTHAHTPIGFVPQNPDLTLFNSTVRAELAFGPRQLGLPASEVDRRVAEASTALAIDSLLDEAPLALSRGQRLRVAVGAAITLRPRLLLLDEPTTGQDQESIRCLLSLVDEMIAAGWSQAVLFATHDWRAVKHYANRVLVLDEGKLIADCASGRFFEDAGLMQRAGFLQPCRDRQVTPHCSNRDFVGETSPP